MTLNISVVTPRRIFQGADYRFTDPKLGWTDAGANQKLNIVNAGGWAALVCFNGVATRPGLNVSEWLSNVVSAISLKDPFQKLIDGLLGADAWLTAFGNPRHSFIVGAFIETKPRLVLVSNYENIRGRSDIAARPRLTVEEHVPKGCKTYVLGQRTVIDSKTRWRLADLANTRVEPDRVYEVMAQVNSDAVCQNKTISPGCFTAHIDGMGRGGGKPHGTVISSMDAARLVSGTAGLGDAFAKVLRDRGYHKGRLEQIATARSAPSVAELLTRTSEEPENPEHHNNLGARLMNDGDVEGAEREYRRAIEIDANYVTALGNLGTILANREDYDEAEDLYRRAVAGESPPELESLKYSSFLLAVRKSRDAAIALLSRALKVNPKSGGLHVERARLYLLGGDYQRSLDDCVQAREYGADQAVVESLFATALHQNGGPLQDCVGAYRTAIVLSPSNGALRLNLAQLLFVLGNPEADAMLRDALQLGLDESALLEAEFYRLAHTRADDTSVLDAMKAHALRGGRLAWDLNPNIDAIRARDTRRAEFLARVAAALSSGEPVAALDRLKR